MSLRPAWYVNCCFPWRHNVSRCDLTVRTPNNPASKQLALSEATYSSNSIAAVGVACHEAGHAIQHARHGAPLWARTALVPLAGIGFSLGYIVMVVGLFLSPFVVLIGAALFGLVLLFQLVTLPVEFDASARAKRLIVKRPARETTMAATSSPQTLHEPVGTPHACCPRRAKP